MNRYVRFERRLEIDEQVEHLRLDRHVERGHRFVADEELGLHRERARDADSRALSAGELVRVAAHQRRVEADLVQHQPHVLDLLLLRHDAVDHRRLADDVDDAQARIERRIRVLEDHLRAQLLAPRLRWRQAGQRLPLPEALAGRRLQQARGQATQRRLAAARFPDQTDDLAGCNLQVDVVDGVHHLLADVRTKAVAELRRKVESLHEALRDSAQLDQRRGAVHRGAARAA